MIILYKQPQSETAFEDIGVKNCWLKYLVLSKGSGDCTKKEHHHTGFEIHIIKSGHQTYEIDGRTYRIEPGQILVVSPKSRHRLIDSAPETIKMAITFSQSESRVFESFFVYKNAFYHINSDQRIDDNLDYILEENQRQRFFSHRLTEGRVFETLILILRLCGMKEAGAAKPENSQDARLLMAKKFINDNIEFDINVPDASAYCYLSTKQLTRLFREYEGITPAGYIQKQKISYIEALLTESTLSLREISERMHFSSEYYFNTFFKKHSGMTPGEYRKSNK